MQTSSLAEAGANCHSFMCDYLSTQFDPAHLLSELGFTIIFELLQVVLVVWLWRKVVKPRLARTIHNEIDAEHQIEHHDDHIHQVEPTQHAVATSTDEREHP